MPTRHATKHLALFTAAALLAGLGVAIAQPPANSTPPAPAAATPSPLAAADFLAGSWQGQFNGSFVEEVWSKPKGPAMMGAFRWDKPDGSPMMFEMLTITREGDATLLRLRHYTPTLTAKEPQDKPQTLRATTTEPARLVFTPDKDAPTLRSITYARQGETLTITVDLASPEGAPPAKPLVFTLNRVK
jgi:hypothetical protein